MRFTILLSTLLIVVLGFGLSSMGQQRDLEAEYREAIRPRPVKADPAELLTSGRVILYGQWLQAPYYLYIDENTLYLNGVAVDPPVSPPWHRPTAVQISPADIEGAELTARLRKVYAALLADKRLSDPQAALLAHIARNESLVRRAEWSGTDKLRLALDNGDEFSMLLRTAIDKQDPTLLRRESLEQTKMRYADALNAGSLLVIGYGPVLHVPADYAAATTTGILEALEAESLERLEQVLFDKELAQEALFIHRYEDR